MSWFSAYAVARTTARPARLLAVSLAFLLTAAGWTALPAHAQNAGQATAAKADPEAMLLEVYKELGKNRLRGAQEKADALVAAYPTFRLGHLVRGDLLLLSTRPIATMGATDGPKDKLDSLRDEARVRLRWLQQRPDPALMPRPVLQLRDDQKQVLVVDAKRSRLYVYENRGGQLRFVSDYYISQGKAGVDKFKEGDQRTPIGVYYITQRVPGPKLPDFYGTGALPINYPNEWDKLHGRGGSGIWLHGVPKDSYSRPPLSSDGCVVLTNTDLTELYQTVEAGKTPVVIADKVEFVSKARWESERALANRLVAEWRRDFESRDVGRIMSNYSRKFKPEKGETLPVIAAKYKKILQGVKSVKVDIKDATYFLYPGRDDLIVGTFTQEMTIGKVRNSVRKRQYWAKESGHWKVISESNL